MSHNGIGYRVYPDDEAKDPKGNWVAASNWINGLVFIKDRKEAFAMAKLGAVNCKFPFIVMKIPIGGKRQMTCYYWTVRR